MNKAVQLACPLDGQSLYAQENSFVCAGGHSFDLARQGYLNLLPVQSKRSKSPGDSAAMIAARQRFLDAGFYDQIACCVQKTISKYIQNDNACLLDAGCGEGFYLDRLHASLMAADINPGMVGLDISRAAIIAAARRNKAITWLVASNKQPPLLPQSVDIIICMFGFPVFDAFKKILKPDGKLLLIEAGPLHLLELRRIIYTEVKQHHASGLSPDVTQGFKMVTQDALTYQTATLDQSRIADLLLMTPHLFRASVEGKQRAAALSQLELTVDVSLSLLQLDA